MFQKTQFYYVSLLLFRFLKFYVLCFDEVFVTLRFSVMFQLFSVFWVVLWCFLLCCIS